MKEEMIKIAELRINMGEIYRRHSEKIARFIKRFVCDPELAEELRQDVFVKIWERGLFLDPDSPGTLAFIFTVAKHTAIDHLRRKKLERKKIRCMNLDEVMMDRRFYENVENSYIRGEVISTMCDVIDSFPEDKRSLFIDNNFHDRKTISVSRERGISVYHIKKNDREVSRRIRENLAPYFEW
ncbi:MAG: sigma-70 family RNA polymerase sigma factor [Spirochaetes bacterium]|nr:sigma-70 family RNA polymerase sigma factor [Spirochaetota bacterium]